MTPTVQHLPLKIVHNFPYPDDAPLEQKKAAVTACLLDLQSRGFGGIVNNVAFHDYTLSEEEWQVFAFTADECERLGMRLWIYDERGYPSGGAGGLTLAEDPSYEARAVVLIRESLAPRASITLELPRGHRHFLYAAAYPADENGLPLPAEDGRYVPLAVSACRHSTAAVTLCNPTDAPAILCAFAEKPLYEGTHSVHNVFEARRYIDVTNRDAVAAFLRNTYDKYAAAVPEHFHAGAGRIIPKPGQIEAVFTDEPSFMGCYINKGLYPDTTYDPYDESIPLYPVLSYGRDVENAFSARYGYDLLPNFTALFLGDTPYARSVRYDYYTLMSDLYEQSFFAQISDWCARHEISFSGHLLLEEEIMHHTVFEGNYFSLLRHMHFPGIDMLQSIPSKVREYAFTPKLISSVARAYNRPHVMSEVSAHAQGGNVTHDQMYASLCAQYALGVDIFTYYYGETFMDPATYTRYNHALGRIDAVMAGRTVADALLYYPIETFRMHHRPSDAWYGSYTEAEKACSENLYAIVNTLLDHQIDFDFIDGEALARMTVDAEADGSLTSTAGDRYFALILPPMDYTADMANRLSDTADIGNVIRVGEGATAIADLPDRLPRRALTAEGATPGVLRLVRDTENGRACMLVNTNDEAVTATFTVSGMTAPVLYDPMEDCEIPCVFAADGDEFRFTVELGALQTRIVREKA